MAIRWTGHASADISVANLHRSHLPAIGRQHATAHDITTAVTVTIAVAIPVVVAVAGVVRVAVVAVIVIVGAVAQTEAVRGGRDRLRSGLRRLR